MLRPGPIESLAVILGLGILVSVAVTRDGGALAITFTQDSEYRREWFTDPEEFAEYMIEAAEQFTLEASVPPSVQVPRKRAQKAR